MFGCYEDHPIVMGINVNSFRDNFRVMNGDAPNCVDCQKSLSVRNQIVSVSNTGLVQSNTNLGYCTILVVSTDNHGLEQTLNVPIKVSYRIMLARHAGYLFSGETHLSHDPGRRFSLAHVPRESPPARGVGAGAPRHVLRRNGERFHGRRHGTARGEFEVRPGGSEVPQQKRFRRRVVEEARIHDADGAG